MIEGTEYSGKSTYAKELKSELEKQGKKVLVVVEPGFTPVGKVIRSLLKEEHEVFDDLAALNLTNEERLLLFFTARSQLCRTLKSIDGNYDVVIWDRGYVSTLVYQFLSKGKSLHMFSELMGYTDTIIMDEIIILIPDKDVIQERIVIRGVETDPLGIEAVEEFEKYCDLYAKVPQVLQKDVGRHSKTKFTIEHIHKK